MIGRGGRPRRAPKYALDSPLAAARRIHLVQAGCALAAFVVIAGATSGGRHPAGAAVAAEPIPPAAIGLPVLTSVDTTPATSAPVAPPTRSAKHRVASARPTALAVFTLSADGIPAIALHAYEQAAATADRAAAQCGIIWPLLAAIGRVESDHGRFGGALLYANGVSAPHIVGIALNGVGTALIRDTDHGRLDGDKVFDRAVGPMQFIPSTWAIFGADGNGDHVKDPFNIFDAAQAAANYLCAAGGNLRTSAGQIQAVMSYNHSVAYLRMVLQLEKTYAAGHFDVRITIPLGAPPTSSPKRLPPVNDGPPITSTTHPTPKPTPTPTSSSPSPTCPSTPASSGPAAPTSSPAAPTTTGASPTGSAPTSASTTGTTTAPATPSVSPSGCPTSGPTATASTAAPTSPASSAPSN